jgi:hypothetical protein
VLVVAISGRNQRTSVANDHSGTPEAFGEQILVLARELRTTAGERAEPGRRPLGGRFRPALPTSLSKHGRNTVVRQLLDQPPQLVPLRTHPHSLTRDSSAEPKAAASHADARTRHTTQADPTLTRHGATATSAGARGHSRTSTRQPVVPVVVRNGGYQSQRIRLT